MGTIKARSTNQAFPFLNKAQVSPSRQMPMPQSCPRTSEAPRVLSHHLPCSTFLAASYLAPLCTLASLQLPPASHAAPPLGPILLSSFTFCLLPQQLPLLPPAPTAPPSASCPSSCRQLTLLPPAPAAAHSASCPSTLPAASHSAPAPAAARQPLTLPPAPAASQLLLTLGAAARRWPPLVPDRSTGTW